MPKCVNVEMNDDGTFTVRCDDYKADYRPEQLVFALEDVVYQFRGNVVKLTTEAAAFNKFHSDLKKEWMSKVQIEEAYANGGLGQMGSAQDRGIKFVT